MIILNLSKYWISELVLQSVGLHTSQGKVPCGRALEARKITESTKGKGRLQSFQYQSKTRHLGHTWAKKYQVG